MLGMKFRRHLISQAEVKCLRCPSATTWPKICKSAWFLTSKSCQCSLTRNCSNRKLPRTSQLWMLSRPRWSLTSTQRTSLTVCSICSTIRKGRDAPMLYKRSFWKTLTSLSPSISRAPSTAAWATNLNNSESTSSSRLSIWCLDLCLCPPHRTSSTLWVTKSPTPTSTKRQLSTRPVHLAIYRRALGASSAEASSDLKS